MTYLLGDMTFFTSCLLRILEVLLVLEYRNSDCRLHHIHEHDVTSSLKGKRDTKFTLFLTKFLLSFFVLEKIRIQVIGRSFVVCTRFHFTVLLVEKFSLSYKTFVSFWWVYHTVSQFHTRSIFSNYHHTRETLKRVCLCTLLSPQLSLSLSLSSPSF
jgi:hypothetical protein